MWFSNESNAVKFWHLQVSLPLEHSQGSIWCSLEILHPMENGPFHQRVTHRRDQSSSEICWGGNYRPPWAGADWGVWNFIRSQVSLGYQSAYRRWEGILAPPSGIFTPGSIQQGQWTTRLPSLRLGSRLSIPWAWPKHFTAVRRRQTRITSLNCEDGS